MNAVGDFIRTFAFLLDFPTTTAAVDSSPSYEKRTIDSQGKNSKKKPF